MKAEEIQSLEMRARFEKFSAQTEQELNTLGLDAKIRNDLLENIVVPLGSAKAQKFLCWWWRGPISLFGIGKKELAYCPIIRLNEHETNAARVLITMIKQRSLLAEEHVCLECPKKVFRQCMNPQHLTICNEQTLANINLGQGEITPDHNAE